MKLELAHLISFMCLSLIKSLIEIPLRKDESERSNVYKTIKAYSDNAKLRTRFYSFLQHDTIDLEKQVFYDDLE